MDPKCILHKFKDGDVKLNLKTVSIWLAFIMVLSFAIGGLLIWTTGISNDDDFEVANLQRENHIFSLEDAQSACLNIDLSLGELTIKGGAKDSIETNFEYNYPILKPKVDYQVSEERAVLAINQPNASVDIPDDIRSEWILHLDERTPTKLDVEVALGAVDMDLSCLNLTEFYLELSAGEVDVNLKNNSGLKDVYIETSFGEVNVDLKDNPELEDVYIDSSFGDVFVDLSGDWEKDLNASLDMNFGSLTLDLPSNVGVRVGLQKNVVVVESSGLKIEDEHYVNEAYGKSDVTLNIDVELFMGEIDLNVV